MKTLTLVVSLLCAATAVGASFSFYPVNVCQDGECQNGLTFYFEGQMPEGSIAVTALQNGKPVTVTQSLKASAQIASTFFFEMEIDPDERHRVISIKIRVAPAEYMFVRPVAGQRYELLSRGGI